MEIIKNKMPSDIQYFIKNFKEYLNLPLYFHGSCQRIDYYNGSDIDVTIFTNNMNSTIEKIKHYLNITTEKIYSVIFYRKNNNVVIFGKKYYYKVLSIPFDIIIYDIKYKEEVLLDNIKDIQIPIYISILLIFIKFFHYKIHLINYNTYSNIKSLFLNYSMNKSQDIFIKI